jgi:hypothetical protein
VIKEEKAEALVERYEKINMELEVTVYNINEGRNAETVTRCEELRGYAYFVHRVRYHEDAERKKGALPETDIKLIAVKKAIQDCKDKSLLAGFLNTLTPEEVNMLVAEWDMTIALEVEREEGYEKGLEKGLEKGHEEVLELLSKGYTLEAIKEELARSVISRAIQA